MGLTEDLLGTHEQKGFISGWPPTWKQNKWHLDNLHIRAHTDGYEQLDQSVSIFFLDPWQQDYYDHET